MTRAIQLLATDSLEFPPLENALQDPNGLLAFGGDLSPERLIKAYKQGIFPWFSEGEPIMWWSPHPRAVISCDNIKINKTLKKVLKKKPYTVTLNKAFYDVIALCADAPFRKEGTWIVPEMVKAYEELHENGYAHSIEVWQDDEIVGGLYGVANNGYFSGESMFYKASNASKIALVSLINLLKEQKISFIDCQITNPFLEDMGCIEIDRINFVKLKTIELANTLPTSFWQQRQLYY